MSRTTNGIPEPPRRNHAVWIGLLLTSFGVVSYFAYFIRFPALRDFPWLNLPIVVVGLAVATLGVVRAYRADRRFGSRRLAPAGLALSVVFAGLFGFYVFGLSYGVPAPTERTLALERAPVFSLPNAYGETVRLSDYSGKRVVLVFYRGFW